MNFEHKINKINHLGIKNHHKKSKIIMNFEAKPWQTPWLPRPKIPIPGSQSELFTWQLNITMENAGF